MFKCYRDGDTEASLFAPMPAHSSRCAFFPAQPLLFRKRLWPTLSSDNKNLIPPAAR
jgi:hypothetical protein